jgi:hypothetical protein
MFTPIAQGGVRKERDGGQLITTGKSSILYFVQASFPMIRIFRSLHVVANKEPVLKTNKHEKESEIKVK